MKCKHPVGLAKQNEGNQSPSTISRCHIARQAQNMRVVASVVNSLRQLISRRKLESSVFEVEDGCDFTQIRAASV